MEQLGAINSANAFDLIVELAKKKRAIDHSTIREYTKTKNYRLEPTRFYETKNTSNLDSFDLLISIGIRI